MSIIQFPEGKTSKEEVSCAICRRSISLEMATAGLCDVAGELMFACNGHFWNGGQLIVGWTNFLSQQRQQMLRRGEEWGNAPALCREA